MKLGWGKSNRTPSESLRPIFRELSQWGIKNILEPKMEG